MKIVFMGYVAFSAELLKVVLSIKEADVVGVVTRKQSEFNSDFVSLEPIAKKSDIPCHFFDDSDQAQLAAWVKSLNADIIYCFGCSELLKKILLDSAPQGVVGYHPAELPKNRGRHPIIWALALGLKRTASTFFMMDEGADSGAIVSQKMIAIKNSDDAASLYAKLVKTAKKQAVDFTQHWMKKRSKFKKQNHRLATYWRKRTQEDGKIDWRMSSQCIYNLVRALNKPYRGAHCTDGSETIKVWKVLPAEKSPDNLEPGLVLKTAIKNKMLVKCGGSDSIWLLKHEFKKMPHKGEYLK